MEAFWVGWNMVPRNPEIAHDTFDIRQKPGLNRAYGDAKDHACFGLRKELPSKSRRTVCVVVQVANDKPFAVSRRIIERTELGVEMVLSLSTVDAAHEAPVIS
jgi:hypothetical protein